MDYYQVLGIQSNATDAEIKKAYRELSFKYHPDKHVNSSELQKKENDIKIKELNEAYETLKDPHLRRQYDNHNEHPFQHIFGDIFKQHQQAFRNPYQSSNMQHPMMNIFDIINELHGQQGEPIIFTTSFDGHHAQSQQNHTPHPIEIKVNISLEESFIGTKIPLMIEREIKNNKGFSYREQERIYVTIPPGIDTDEMITIPEKGNEHNGVKGEVKVQIVLKPNKLFERNGLNLIYKHTITFKESIVGFDFILNHIDGNSFKIKSSRGNIIQNLEEKIIKGKGFARDGSIGDLMIVFKVLSPKTLTEEEISTLENVLS